MRASSSAEREREREREKGRTCSSGPATRPFFLFIHSDQSLVVVVVLVVVCVFLTTFIFEGWRERKKRFRLANMVCFWMKKLYTLAIINI